MGGRHGPKRPADILRITQWTVHCPAKLVHLFPAAMSVIADDSLNLTQSLRSHLAEDVHRGIQCLLDGGLSEAAGLATRIAEQGFDMYVTDSLDKANDYLHKRYDRQTDKRYGILASSKAKNLVRIGIRNDFSFTKNLREGPWYNDDPESARSCCQLRDVATEFSCQGLELDFPLVAWGDDFTWDGTRWASVPQPRSHAHDPHRLRINSYRVLLSRGRDGFVIFVPPEPALPMTTTCDALKSAGVRPLP